MTARMASLARVLSATRWLLWRQIQTYSPPPPSPPPSPPLPPVANPSRLLATLLCAPDSAVKLALEEASSAAPRDAAFWDPLAAALRASAPRKAQLVLEWRLETLLKEGVRDREPYCNLIGFCGKIVDVPFAMRVFTSMEAAGIRPSVSIFNALIAVCLSAGNLVTALSLFEIMSHTEDCKPDPATYDTFVSFYSKLGNAGGVMNWYSAAKKAGLGPTIQTYESLIAGFVKLGQFNEAKLFFEEMKSLQIMPTLTILEAKLEMLCNMKDLHGIKAFVKFITDGSYGLSGAMAEKIARLYLDLGLINDMDELLSLTSGSMDVGVLTQVHCGIIRFHAHSDRLDDMEHAVHRMLEGGMVFVCPEDIEAVICCYFRRQSFNRLDLFLDRIRRSHRLARSTYDILVAGYRKFEIYRRLDATVKEMKLAGYV